VHRRRSLRSVTGVNAIVSFVWRRLYQRGLLTTSEAAASARLLQVKVSTPTLLPSEQASASKPSPKSPSGGTLEIEFA
jgi:hypothetical protein